MRIKLSLGCLLFVLLQGAVMTSIAKDNYEPPKPALEFLARFTVNLDADIWELGQTSDLGRRRIVPITGGSVAGARLTGKILNNGADWQIVTADNTALIDTRYLLQTDDGALIYLQTKGFRYGPKEVLAELAKGNAVDPTTYSFRMSGTFETSDARYRWLNRAIMIGSGMRQAKAVVYDAYVVL